MSTLLDITVRFNWFNWRITLDVGMTGVGRMDLVEGFSLIVCRVELCVCSWKDSLKILGHKATCACILRQL